MKQETTVYIHWPYCTKKCPYCDFNSFVTNKIDHEKWTNAYMKAIEHYKNYLQNKVITSIFFGGGTPSLATPNMIKKIICELNRIAEFSSNIEITLEANPTSVEAQKFVEFREAGVNRVSLGVQSLREKNLQFLGRNHSANEAIRAIESVKQSFENYSLDFIYALPHQTLNEWEVELREAISLASNHLSLYQLTIEKSTKFGAMARQGLLNEIDETVAVEMFSMTYEITKDHGLHRYEVSNHARHGYESQHNSNYWRYGDYIGIGPGAHGRITLENKKFTTVDIRQPDSWITSVMSKGNGIESQEGLDNDETRLEKILMGMRTIEGVNMSLLKDKEKEIFNMIQDGLLEMMHKDRIRATNNGLLLLNSIIERLSL